MTTRRHDVRRVQTISWTADASLPVFLRASALTSALVVALLPTACAATSDPSPTAEHARAMLFGLDAPAVDAVLVADAPPDLAMVWVGAWNLEHGFHGATRTIERIHDAGVRPVVQFYYWGDDISSTCLHRGCWSGDGRMWKTMDGWRGVADRLVAALHDALDGAPATVVLETEFNKASVATSETLDAALAEMAARLRVGYPDARIVLGFGNWGSWAWSTFDRAADAADAVGLQAMRASTRHTAAEYADVLDETIAAAARLSASFGKPVHVTALALSSYPEPEYAPLQRAGVEAWMWSLGALKAAGVVSVSYVALVDNPAMGLGNHFGMAERHWGLAWAGNDTGKPALGAWNTGVAAERAAPATPEATAPAQTAPPAPPRPTPLPPSEPDAAPAPLPEASADIDRIRQILEVRRDQRNGPLAGALEAHRAAAWPLALRLTLAIVGR